MGSEWFVARATLALRRSGRFARGWALSVGTLALIALVIPFASGDPNAAEKSRLERQAADTLLSAQRLRRAEAAMAVAESTLAAAQAQPELPRRVVVPPRAIPTVTRALDPALTSLDEAIQEARRLRTVTSWMTVAGHPAVGSGPRMRGLGDSLTALSVRRDALVSGPERDQQVADLTQRIGRVGYTILAIAENRRGELMAGGGPAVAPAPLAPAPTAIAAMPSPIARLDTVALLAARTTARDTLAASRRRHDSLVLAVRSAGTALAGRGRSTIALASPAIALALILLVGLLVRVASALSQEMNAPTLAHAHEAERVSGAPVLATVRDAMLDGPARFRPSGVDPFRMLYLSLTATGTRARTAIVTGSDPLIAAATGARLAIAAAADHRTTLIVDLDPVGIGLARVFRERAEPGLTDALAGAFRWRELARPVGSSDGLPITLLPAGTERDVPTGDAFAEVRDEFSKFRASYELTIFVAPRAQLELAAALLGSSPLILTALAGETLVGRFAAESELIRSAGLRLQGTVLWDAPKPEVPSRAELAALLSKRKGRTPGGSFEAVNKAIGNKKT